MKPVDVGQQIWQRQGVSNDERGEQRAADPAQTSKIREADQSVSRSKVYDLVNSGAIKSVKVQNMLRIPASEAARLAAKANED